MKISIVVTHLLGTGHLARALTLARAFDAAGHDTTVVSGGMNAPQLNGDGINLVQLPPLRSDGVDFARLLDSQGAPAGVALFKARRDMLIGHLRANPPDVLITELFPFGRRILKDEFTALLMAAHALPRCPLICASVRDILAPPSKPAKARLADDLVATYYDAVLVHSVADVTPLALSWPVSDALATKLHYTGFVAPPPARVHPTQLGADEVIVSAGGSDVGAHLFGISLAAAKRDPQRRWRLLVGGAGGVGRSAKMALDAPANMVIEPAHPAFRQMLHHAAASVSLCGYNTALDVLQSGVRAIFVPFDAGSEVEQGLRADALAKLSGVAVLRNADLTADTLLAALDAVLADPPRSARTAGFDGAAQTVAITEALRNDMS